MYFFVLLFCFLLFFLLKFIGHTFSSINTQIKLISLIKIKKISYMNLLKIDQFVLNFVHKITNLITYRSTCMYEKLRNFRTIHLGAVSLVLKYAQNSNKNCLEISRREHCAFRISREKSRGGGAKLAPPPPRAIIGLMNDHHLLELGPLLKLKLDDCCLEWPPRPHKGSRLSVLL